MLLLTVLTALTLMTVDARAGQGSPLDPVRRGADTVFGPALRFAGAGARTVGSVFSGLPRLAGYQEEAARLRAENERLRGELARGADDARQLAQARDLLGLRDRGGFTLVPAYVSGRTTFAGFDNAITLDVGERSGIRKDQTVVSGLGLVGRVLRVGPTSCSVVLITDDGFSAGAMVAKRGGSGVAKGDGPRGLVYEQVEGPRLAVGDELITNGGTLARGIPIGRVSVVRSVNTQVKTALIEPLVDVSSLDLVAVITADPAAPPRVPVAPRPRAATPAPTRAAPPAAAPAGVPAATPAAPPAATPAGAPVPTPAATPAVPPVPDPVATASVGATR